MRARLLPAVLTLPIFGAAAHAAIREPSFVEAHPFVRQHLETMQAAAREANLSAAARPPIPSPCNATDSGDSIRFTWTDVSQATGYYVYRDGDLVATLGPAVTSFEETGHFGTHSYCIMAFNLDGVSDVCCDTGAQTTLPAPSPCSIGPVGGHVAVQWTASPGAEGYRVFADATLFATLPAGELSVGGLTPGVSYCVEAFAGATTSSRCCQTPELSGPASCSIGPYLGKTRFQWTPAPLTDGYHVYRDSALIATVAANQLSVDDMPPAGLHEYCVDAFMSSVASSPCCQSMQIAVGPLDSPAPCSAKSNGIGGIRVSWTDVEGEDGYDIYRDGNLVASVPRDTTSYFDPVVGDYYYCVSAYNGSGSGPECCGRTNDFYDGAFARLSWGTCDPQINNQDFQGPHSYALVLSAAGDATENVGHAAELRFGPVVPDAWRFDSGGCQTESQLHVQVNTLGESCPAMLGTNPQTTLFTLYENLYYQWEYVRLTTTYDNFATMANQRYVLWEIVFDHSKSIAGSDANPSTCDGASTPLNFYLDFTSILLLNGLLIHVPDDQGDQPATWNGGQVKTQPVTWGRVKALYR